MKIESEYNLYVDSVETDTPHSFMSFKLVMQHLLSKIKTE